MNERKNALTEWQKRQQAEFTPDERMQIRMRLSLYVPAPSQPSASEPTA